MPGGVGIIVTPTVRCLPFPALAIFVVAFGFSPASLSAQEKKIPICEIKQTRVGFLGNEAGAGSSGYSSGSTGSTTPGAGPTGGTRRS